MATDRRMRSYTHTPVALILTMVAFLVAVPAQVGAAPARGGAPLSESSPGLELWMSQDHISTDGGVLAVAVVNRSGTRFGLYGVKGQVERWSGSAWEAHGSFTGNLTGWGGPFLTRPQLDPALYDDDSFHQPDEDFEVLVPAIGFDVPAMAAGPLQWLRAGDDLEPGFYRLSHFGDDGARASGVLEVVSGGPAAPDYPSDRTSWLRALPELIPHEAVDVEIAALGGGRSGVEEWDAFQLSLEPELWVSRWDGNAWIDLLSLPVTPADPAAQEGASVALPPLEPGVYKITQFSSTDGYIDGILFVEEGVPVYAFDLGGPATTTTTTQAPVPPAPRATPRFTG